MSLFPLKLLKLYTTSKQQQALDKVRFFNPAVYSSALPLNHSNPNTND